MPNTQLVNSAYKKLVSDIAGLYEGARRALVEAYWKIGQRIVEVEQKGEIKAAYGTGLIPKLSEDLTKRLGSGFSLRQLADMRRFYLANKNLRPAAKLGWTQHVELLKIEDTQQRNILERKAIEECLKRDEIRELVRHELVREQVAENLGSGSFSGVEKRCQSQYRSIEAKLKLGQSWLPSRKKISKPGLTPLIPIRGTLYTYRIIQPKLVGAGESELLIDLGFSCTQDLDNITDKKFKPGDIVVSSKDLKGNYSLRAPSPNPGGEGKGEGILFTYKAEVEKIVDGDTLRVVVDLGFGFKTRQYLRLRGLDCPEMDTPEGKKASEFVRNKIKTSDEIILTSSRSDKYDRYLADVYFLDAKGQEFYLSNLLLESGLAIRI